MKHNFKVNPVLLAALIFSIGLMSYGQTAKQSKVVSGGVVNGKAVTLPKPEYPEDARRAKIGGVVKIQVLIDETGRVISAKAVGGHESGSLRQAAEAAALQATFSPTRLSGQPVKVSGVIAYNFVEATNEEKLQIMGVSTFMGLARHLAADLDKLKEIFEGEDMFREGAAEYPQFAEEFTSLASLEKLTVDKRLEAFDKALSSVQSKLGPADRWQFEAGQDLAGIMGPLMALMASGAEHDDLLKFDESGIKLSLKKLKDLTLSAPADFPQDVLEKLKEFSALGTREKLLAPENLEEFGSKMMALLETISPEPTK